VRVGLGLPYSAAVRVFGRDAARETWQNHRESRLRLEGVLRLLGRECGYRQAGGFRLAESRQGGLSLVEGEDLLREDGFSGEFFDHHMLEARFDVQGFAAGYWAADDAELDAQELLDGLVSAAEQMGVAVHERSPVVELELSAAGAVAVTRSGAWVRAPLAVVAAGGGSGELLPWLTARLQVSDDRQLRLEANPAAALPAPGSAKDGRLAWRASRQGLLVRGAQPEAFAEHFLAFPCLVRESASGPRAATSDELPLAGPVPGLPVLTACGFGGAALGSAFEVAHWIAEAAAGRDVIPARWRADRKSFDTGP
jgi:glycine/D-amino acid oxidase-like deaminating enzyme